MSGARERRKFWRTGAQDRAMASEREEAAGAAWAGADLERPIEGEDPTTLSLGEARHWVAVYSHLVRLEQDLLDLLAGILPNMPSDAQQEAEETNLPVLATQLERFKHRLEFWAGRRAELEGRG